MLNRASNLSTRLSLEDRDAVGDWRAAKRAAREVRCAELAELLVLAREQDDARLRIQADLRSISVHEWDVETSA